MRIAFYQWHATGYAGTQSWTYTLARYYRSLGHDVVLHAGKIGMIAARMMGEGFKVYSHYRDDPQEADLSIVSQPRMLLVCPWCGLEFAYDTDEIKIPKHLHRVTGKSCAYDCAPKSKLPKGNRVYVLHGWLPHDKPLIDGSPYVTVSKETHDSLLGSYKIESTIIRQPIDLGRFFATGPCGEETVLLLSTHPAEYQALEAQILSAGKKLFERTVAAQFWDVERQINSADIVIGTGRGIAEALACGRNAIVCGKFGVDGLVTPDNIEQLETVNYSGRLTMSPIDALKDELLKPMPGLFANRAMSKRFDVAPIGDTLLKVGGVA